VVMCGNCHRHHDSVSEVRTCFRKPERDADRSKVDDSRVGIEPPEQVLASRAGVTVTQPTTVPKRGVSCGSPFHYHNTVPEARDCYLKRSDEQIVKLTVTCRHGIKSGRCNDCKNAPEGVNTMVFITERGAAFHNVRDCRALLEGQDRAAAMGLNTYEVVSVHWSMVAFDRQPCRMCCQVRRNGT
jgi:hypothetical protein